MPHKLWGKDLEIANMHERIHDRRYECPERFHLHRMEVVLRTTFVVDPPYQTDPKASSVPPEAAVSDVSSSLIEGSCRIAFVKGLNHPITPNHYVIPTPSPTSLLVPSIDLYRSYVLVAGCGATVNDDVIVVINVTHLRHRYLTIVRSLVVRVTAV